MREEGGGDVHEGGEEGGGDVHEDLAQAKEEFDRGKKRRKGGKMPEKLSQCFIVTLFHGTQR